MAAIASQASMLMSQPAAKAGMQLYTGIAQYQSRRRNAALAAQNADQGRRVGVIAGENRQRQSEKSVGAAKARAGASGFTLAGSAASVISQLAAEGNQGASTALYDGLIRGRSGDNKAKDLRSAATLGLISAGFKAGDTILTAVSQSKISQRKS